MSTSTLLDFEYGHVGAGVLSIPRPGSLMTGRSVIMDFHLELFSALAMPPSFKRAGGFFVFRREVWYVG